MGKLTIHRDCGGIGGLTLIEPAVFGDARGYFQETYSRRDMEAAGFSYDFVQDNESLSSRGVLRGLHFQREHPQGKLVRAVLGEVYDVAVDLRGDSETFGKHFGVILSEKKKNQLLIPPGFAHGFLVLSETAVFAYKTTDFYHPGDEGGLLWNDPALGIDWPVEEAGGAEKLLLAERDTAWPTLAELTGEERTPASLSRTGKE